MLTAEADKSECETAEQWCDENIRFVTSHIAGLQAMKASVKEFAS